MTAIKITGDADGDEADAERRSKRPGRYVILIAPAAQARAHCVYDMTLSGFSPWSSPRLLSPSRVELSLPFNSAESEEKINPITAAAATPLHRDVHRAAGWRDPGCSDSELNFLRGDVMDIEREMHLRGD